MSKQRLRLWLRILRASRVLETEIRERLRLEFGVTLPQFDVLAALARRGQPMTMTDLSRTLMVSNGNVTGIIDRLEAEGLAERAAADLDRRATLVRLTPAGARRFDAMATMHERWVDELLAGVGRIEANTMIDQLDSLARRVREGAKKQ